MRRGLGTSGTLQKFQHPNRRPARRRRGRARMENLFENIMKENFPNLAKEIDFQEVQETQSPKEVGPKEEHNKAHHNYVSQD